MATVTKPIALDESLNTTELSSRNVADVLAQELSAVATAIGGIAIPSADHVSYDNSGSGLSATDVQNALDEIVSDIPAVNNGTLNIQQNGTSKGSFTANSGSNVNVNIETPTADKKTATDQFTTADGGLLSKCMIDLVPVQSGSGDPYPAGGGKNKFDQSVFSTDVGTTITYLTYATANGTYTMSTPDFPFDGSTCNVFFLAGAVSSGASTNNNGVAINKSITIEVTDGYYTVAYRSTFTINTNNPKDFNFQIEIGSTATDYAPYSNVRPISGHTEVDLYNVGKNRLPLTLDTIKSENTAGTWSGNVYTIGNLKFEVLLDNYRNVIGIKANGSHTSNVSFRLYNDTFENGTYYFNGISGGSTTTYLLYSPQGGELYNGNGGLNVNSNTLSLVFAIRANVTVSNVTVYPMVRVYGETSTFEPYLGHLYQVQIGSTVYGGTVDLVSGVMTATWAWVDLGTLGWAYNSSRTRFEANISDIKYAADRYHLIMPNYKFFQGSPNDMPDFNYTCSNNSTGIYVKNSLYGSDTASFIASMTGYIGVYELATPQTIQLTPQQIETLAGQNNLSTPLSGQSIETNGVEYKELFTFADVKEYVDKKIPDAPTTDGTYTLQAVVSGGVPTYSWV